MGDFVALIIHDSQYCGIAFLGPRVDLMYSVTAWNCATGYFSFGHEIGHNMGLNHDKGTSNACSNQAYNYGYRDPDAQFRSILAYSCRSGQCDNNAGNGRCTRVQRFSNPNFGYNGSPIGTANIDNARQINDVRVQVAEYFPHGGTGTVTPSKAPVKAPTSSPVESPTSSPTSSPIESPTSAPFESPFASPTKVPTTGSPCIEGSWDQFLYERKGKHRVIRKNCKFLQETKENGQLGDLCSMTDSQSYPQSTLKSAKDVCQVTCETCSSNCVELGSGKFFRKKNWRRVVIQKCEWLMKKTASEIAAACAIESSPSEFGPAKDVCPITCGTC